MIELYDRYSQESRDLHESLVATGLSQLGVVIDADGFLPDGLVSPFTYYLGYEKGKPLYFNQVPVPAFWEISGNNQSARIEDMTQERAVIHYADGLQARLVKQVDWKDLEVEYVRLIIIIALVLALLQRPIAQIVSRL